jgi:hypothetical protein
MTRRFYLQALGAVMFAALLSVAVTAQDFQKSYRIGAGGQIRVGNVSGDVIVTGSDGDQVVVKGFKDGPDSDKLDVKDQSTDGRVDVSVHYPKDCQCQAGIRFEVQVPRSVNFDVVHFSSVSGTVDVSSVTGHISASSVSGQVKVHDVSGSVSASSVSGNVEVAISQLGGSDDMRFSSVSGNVNVSLPANIDANVDLTSLSGTINTDFPIEVTKEHYGPRTFARGKLGNGSARQLKMSSISGSVSLRHS